MIFEAFKPFTASEFLVKFATEPWEKRGAAALRRLVFCEEQGIFTGDDRDPIDETAITLVALSVLGVATRWSAPYASMRRSWGFGGGRGWRSRPLIAGSARSARR